MYGLDGPVPYEEIDCEVRKLVRLINECPGIRTLGCCAGHEAHGNETQIDFIGESPQAIHKMLASMPFQGFRGGFANNHPQTEFIWATVTPKEGHLVYTLRIGGSPFHVQRALLGKVEAALERNAPSQSAKEAQ
jgi:hypothetical protein